MTLMWIPKWLGESYSKLLTRFGQELFTFQQAKEFLSVNETKLAVTFNKLHSKRILLIFDRGKPRLYRLLNPENFILLASENVQNVEKIPQERYLRLILDCFRQTSEKLNIDAFAIYGSVARGTAGKTSDIDILVISEELRGSLGSRIGMLYGIEETLQDELRWLRKKGIYAGLSFYALRRFEAQRLPNLFLDLTEDAVILQDQNRFLEKTLLDLKMTLLEMGARRVFINRERWYWDLKPDYKFGERIAIA